MRVVSINVGRPREVQFQGQPLLTSIFKAPVTGPVIVTSLNLKGDQQSDLTVHGGVNKAVYVYPSEHYAFWRAELPDVPLEWGAFGENLTTETDVVTWRLAGAVVEAMPVISVIRRRRTRRARFGDGWLLVRPGRVRAAG